MYVCIVYMYMYICMYVYMYAFMYVRMYVCMYVCLYVMYILGVCDYQNMWYPDFANYCLESITINRLIGDLDNSAANKTILLLQVLKVMLMPSADYQFNRSLQCASKIASASDLRGCGP